MTSLPSRNKDFTYLNKAFTYLHRPTTVLLAFLVILSLQLNRVEGVGFISLSPLVKPISNSVSYFPMCSVHGNSDSLYIRLSPYWETKWRGGHEDINVTSVTTVQTNYDVMPVGNDGELNESSRTQRCRDCRHCCPRPNGGVRRPSLQHSGHS